MVISSANLNIFNILLLFTFYLINIYKIINLIINNIYIIKKLILI